MGKNNRWNKEKRDLLKLYLEQGLTYGDIAERFKVGYDAIKHAVVRYNLKEGIEDSSLFQKTKNKLSKKDISKLGKLIGEQIFADFKPIKLHEPKYKKTKGKREEISILDLSDVHIGMVNETYDNEQGKKVVTYNHQIFLKELNNLQESIFQIHSILSNSYKLNKLVIFVMGDIITNDRIFPEQIFEIEACVGQQVWKVIPAFSQFFNNLLKIYKEIEVVCVVGNHGRSNPHHYNEPVQNNFEYFIYKTWEKQFENSKRIKVIVPDTRRYIHTVGKWRHLIEHGDQLRGYTDTAIEKQLKEIYVNVGGFDVMHFAHLHKLKEREISDKVLVKQNGCWIYKDNYAWNKFKTFSVPKQHFFGCNNKRPETWSYKLDLRG